MSQLAARACALPCDALCHRPTSDAAWRLQHSCAGAHARTKAHQKSLRKTNSMSSILASAFTARAHQSHAQVGDACSDTGMLLPPSHDDVRTAVDVRASARKETVVAHMQAHKGTSAVPACTAQLGCAACSRRSRRSPLTEGMK